MEVVFIVLCHCTYGETEVPKSSITDPRINEWQKRDSKPASLALNVLLHFPFSSSVYTTWLPRLTLF
jgi:hypothetical protein